MPAERLDEGRFRMVDPWRCCNRNPGSARQSRQTLEQTKGLAIRHFYSAHGTISNETSQLFVATSWFAGASLASIPGLQRAQSVVRKCPPNPHYWVPFYQHHYLRSSAAEVCSHSKWQSVCFGFGRVDQRSGAKHLGHKQHAIENHDHYHRHLRAWHSKGASTNPEREFGLFGLHQWWDQPSPRLDDHLGAASRLEVHACFARICGTLHVPSHAALRRFS